MFHPVLNIFRQIALPVPILYKSIRDSWILDVDLKIREIIGSDELCCVTVTAMY